jgi:hypothetical protein
MLSSVFHRPLLAWAFAATTLIIIINSPLLAASPAPPVPPLDASSEFFAMPGASDAEPFEITPVMPVSRNEERANSRALAVDQTCDTNPDEDDGRGFIHAPADVSGAVGPKNLVVVTNVHIGVYKKNDCSKISRVPLLTFFGTKFTIPGTETLVSPRALYDTSAQRFAVIALSTDTDSSRQWLYLAVSKTSTGTTWYLYRIALVTAKSFACDSNLSSPPLVGNPNLGRNSNRWLVSATISTFTSLVLSIDKAPTLAGAKLTAKCFAQAPNNFGNVGDVPGPLAAPIVLDDNAQAHFIFPCAVENAVGGVLLTTSDAGPASDKLRTRGLGTFTNQLPGFAFQPNGQKLFPAGACGLATSMQAGKFVWLVITVAHAGGDSKSHPRWVMLKVQPSKFDAKVVFSKTLSTVPADDDDDTFNASLATTAEAAADVDVPVFITFTRTIQSNAKAGAPSMMVAKGPNGRAAGWSTRLIAKSPQQMSIISSTTGAACNTGANGCFWGFWSSVAIDPSDPTRAWGFNELVLQGTEPRSQFSWTTKAANFH